MTLTLKFDVFMVNMYTENEVPNESNSQNKQTDRSDWNYYLPTYVKGKKHLKD